MLRNRRLLHLQNIHNLPYWPFLQRQIVQNLPPPRLRDSIESIGGGCRSCHGSYNTFLYRNVSSNVLPALFSPTAPKPITLRAPLHLWVIFVFLRRNFSPPLATLRYGKERKRDRWFFANVCTSDTQVLVGCRECAC